MDNYNNIDYSGLETFNSSIKDVYFNSHKSPLLLFLSFIPAVICAFLLSTLLTGYNESIKDCAPYYVWISLIVLFLFFKTLYSNYSYQLVFVKKKKKLVKRIFYFNSQFDKTILDFKDINIIGVSSIFKKRRVKHHYYITERHQVIVLYGKYNNIKVIEEDNSISNLNSVSKLAAELVPCKVIEGDGRSRLVKGNNSDLPIKKISYEDQINGFNIFKELGF